LRETLSLSDSSLPSVRVFAKARAITPTHLRAMLPELTSCLVLRRQNAIQERRAAAERELLRRVETVLAELDEEGLPRTRRHVEARLPKAGVVRAPLVRAFLRGELAPGAKERRGFLNLQPSARDPHANLGNPTVDSPADDSPTDVRAARARLE